MTSQDTPSPHARLRTLAEKATPGPWEVIPPRKTGGALGDAGDRGIDAAGVAIGEMWEHCPWRGNPDGIRQDAAANAAYIAAANPQAVLGLLDEIEGLKARVAELEKEAAAKQESEFDQAEFD